MDKRGQIFILSAIIIILLLYSAVYTYNSINVYGGIEDFNENVDQFEKESTLVVNDAIYKGDSGAQQADALKEWANIFKEGVKSSDPNFGSISIYKDTDGNVHVINTLTDQTITIEYLADDADAEGTEISFFSKNIPSDDQGSEGIICTEDPILGPICTKVNTNLAEFGKKFDYAQTIEGVDLAFLCIKIEGMTLQDPKAYDSGNTIKYDESICQGGAKIPLSGFQGIETSSKDIVVGKKGETEDIIKIDYPYYYSD